MVLLFILGIANLTRSFALLLGGGEGDTTDFVVAEVQPLATIRTVIARRVRAITDIDLLAIGGHQEKERYYDQQPAHFVSD